MARKYVKKTEKRLISTKADFQTAVDRVRRGELTQRQAASNYGISQQNLSRHILGQRGTKSSSLGRPPVIPLDMETRLANGLKLMEKWGFGLSRHEVLLVVADFVKTNSIVNPFKNGIPGEQWFLGFKNRHKLSIKKPQSVEYARKKMTDPFVIQDYFSLLKQTVTDLRLEDKPAQIWNLDEASFCVDPSKTKVVGGKGAPSSRTTAGSGKENTTVLSGCNAEGKKAPPLIIFKGKNVWDQWIAPKESEYPGTSYAATVNGWMETEIFENYFQKIFLPCVGAARPVLLIYDGHSTHISAKIIELAIKENVTILKLPPHTSHILQPLDLSVFKPMKTKWDQSLVQWQRSHVGKRLAKQEFAILLGETWTRISDVTIKKGFAKAGIYPFNSNVIPENRFDPEAVQRFKKSKVMVLHPSQSANPNQPASVPLPETPTQPNSQSDLNHIDPIPVTFETLLLSTVRQSPVEKPKKKTRVCPGAEVITCEEALKKLSEIKDKPAPAKPRAKPSAQKNVKNGAPQKRPHPTGKACKNPTKKIRKDPTDQIHVGNELKIGAWIFLKPNLKHGYTAGQILSKNHSVGQGDWNVRFLIFEDGHFKWPQDEVVDSVLEVDFLKVSLPPKVDENGLLTFA